MVAGMTPETTAHINALATLTGRPVDDLAADAVRLLREQLVPSTRPAPTAKAGRKPKAAQ